MSVRRRRPTAQRDDPTLAVCLLTAEAIRIDVVVTAEVDSIAAVGADSTRLVAAAAVVVVWADPTQPVPTQLVAAAVVVVRADPTVVVGVAAAVPIQVAAVVGVAAAVPMQLVVVGDIAAGVPI